MSISLTADEERTLRQHPLFAGLTDPDFAEALVLCSAVKKSYQRDEFIKHTGEAFTAFGLVLAGSVLVLTDDLEGNPMLMAHVERANTFGEALCFLKKTPPVYVLAAEKTDLLWLRPTFSAGQSGTPEGRLMSRFTALLAERTLSMNERIQILSHKSIREKLMTYFQRYVRAEGRIFEIPLSRSALALYLGTDRAALSRELAHMKADGLIDYDGKSFKVLI